MADLVNRIIRNVVTKEFNTTTTDRQRARDDIEESSFASTVWSDDGMELTRLERQINAI